jgi:hypothetical protein
MKKAFCTVIMLVLIGTTVFAQEAGEEAPAAQAEQEDQAAADREAQAAQAERVQRATQAAGVPTGGVMGVNMGPLGMGLLSIDGLVLFGARARGAYQEGWEKDGNWALEGIQATWDENRFDLYINYSFRNYGVFLGLRAQYWGPNNVSYGWVEPRYAFIYGNFGPAKVSVGKLYDEIIPVPGSRIWKSTGPGDSHRFTDDDEYSIRLEVKPVEGLNVGFQLFFPQFEQYSLRTDGRDGVSQFYKKGMDETDAWKELGFGAQYSNNLFDAQLGVRLDSEVDRYWKLDTGPMGAGTYLSRYYGQASMLARQMTDPRAISWLPYPATATGCRTTNTGISG